MDFFSFTLLYHTGSMENLIPVAPVFGTRDSIRRLLGFAETGPINHRSSGHLYNVALDNGLTLCVYRRFIKSLSSKFRRSRKVYFSQSGLLLTIYIHTYEVHEWERLCEAVNKTINAEQEPVTVVWIFR